jgi:anaerobic dimethyl sulfoxide reductase subunit B (iron-sulfur subunit)
MTQYGFFVNTDICIGCKACMTACFDRNDLEVPWKFRKVYEFGGGDWQNDDHGGFTTTAFTYYASMTCCHCDAPACVANCPTGAMQKDSETGIVNNDKEICIGCMKCEASCPYNHPVKLADGLSHKCSLCNDQSSDKSPEPVCAVACPVRALEFGLIEDLRTAHGDSVMIGTLGDTTAPNVVIGLHRDASKGGELLNPTEINH